MDYRDRVRSSICLLTKHVMNAAAPVVCLIGSIEVGENLSALQRTNHRQFVDSAFLRSAEVAYQDSQTLAQQSNLFFTKQACVIVKVQPQTITAWNTGELDCKGLRTYIALLY